LNTRSCGGSFVYRVQAGAEENQQGQNHAMAGL
jgi:hypothetical protein